MRQAPHADCRVRVQTCAVHAAIIVITFRDEPGLCQPLQAGQFDRRVHHKGLNNPAWAVAVHVPREVDAIDKIQAR